MHKGGLLWRFEDPGSRALAFKWRWTREEAFCYSLPLERRGKTNSHSVQNGRDDVFLVDFLSIIVIISSFV